MIPEAVRDGGPGDAQGSGRVTPWVRARAAGPVDALRDALVDAPGDTPDGSPPEPP
ncbi:hypothetical protein [Streptomyces stephensoniae]|uniref:hypothetical protein n=1 Tax=Streptomyces stephensoniae TaxID=3375367 RepID=UPI002889696B|nr:hypothetical protein [Streptomyces griseus]